MDPTLAEFIRQMPTVAAVLWLIREQANERRQRDLDLAAKEDKEAAAMAQLDQDCRAFQTQIVGRFEVMWSSMQAALSELHRLIGSHSQPPKGS